MTDLIFVFVVISILSLQIDGERSFKVGYDENTFLKDGEPFRYISGSLHYFRIPSQYWEDRLLKMKAGGLDTIQIYVEWNSHEREYDVYDFEGDLDLVEFIKTAQKVGLYVILRPGPYIDAERDMGGLPYWLLTKNKNVVLRTMDPDFIKYVEKWFSKLLPLMKPLLYVNGGPIIMVQVENEYGSYFACDRDYVAYISHKIRQELGIDIQLFTTDGDGEGYLKCGHTTDAYGTVDFGAGVDVNKAFAVIRTKEVAGPFVNSEYYAGWLDHWGQPHAKVDQNSVAKTLDEMLAVNASVNIYMFHGGTSFGFTSGSNIDGNNFDSCPTSYDYDAPINEAGDLTTKYYAIKEVIAKYKTIPDVKIKPIGSKIKLGPVKLQPFESNLLTTLRNTSKSVSSVNPLSFEELSHGYGFVLYETKLAARVNDPVMLSIPGIKDRGYVFVNDKYQGVISRGQKISTIPLRITQNQTLSILVENQGRVCYGTYINDTKGIFGQVKLGPLVLENWTIYPPNLALITDSPQNTRSLNSGCNGTTEPGFFKSIFKLPNNTQLADTFIKLEGWTKGVAWINGFNLGRYWPNEGPQVTLYLPGVWLNPYPEDNTLILMELEESPCENFMKQGCSVEFVDTPILDGLTPGSPRKAKYVTSGIYIYTH